MQPDFISNLQRLYEVYTALKETYIRTNNLLRITQDDEVLSTLHSLEKLLDKYRENLLLLERINLAKLEKAVGAPDYPYSIKTWYEDEHRNLWSGLED